MPVYAYRGRNTQTNETISGERFANSPQALAALLRREQIAAVSIREKGAGANFNIQFGTGVSQIEIAVFTRQFAVMLDAGLPLVQCLEAIAQQQTNERFKVILEAVRADVESGATLSDAMGKHPKVFDKLFTSMIAAGEAGGVLDTILQRLAQFIDKIVKLKSALRSAIIYPASVLSVAVVVVAIILWKVIPVFRTLFEGFNVELPIATRAVIQLSRLLETYFLVLLVLIALIVAGIRAFYSTENGRLTTDRTILRTPIFGDIFRKIAVARFTRTLATLLTSGVAILESLDITTRIAGNAVLEGVIRQVRRSIEEGKTMSDPMRQSKFFPPMVTQMVAIGETTGELDNMLTKVADYYEEEVDTIIANLLKILEPMITVVLGGVVGFVVIAMYWPMFKLISVLSGG